MKRKTQTKSPVRKQQNGKQESKCVDNKNNCWKATYQSAGNSTFKRLLEESLMKVHSAEDEGTVKGTSRASEVSQFSKWGSLLSSKDWTSKGNNITGNWWGLGTLEKGHLSKAVTLGKGT